MPSGTNSVCSVCNDTQSGCQSLWRSLRLSRWRRDSTGQTTGCSWSGVGLALAGQTGVRQGMVSVTPSTYLDMTGVCKVP